jgi:hypothetical protein
MGSGRPPGSDLPAPYESPWRRLGQDLQAVGASLRLRAWELLRRNRQGELWRPPFWPESLASLFWPALLGGILVLALVLGGRGMRPQPPSPGPAGSAEQAGAQESSTPPEVTSEKPVPPSAEATDPGVRDPGVRDPGVRDPGVRDPGVRDPGVRDPGVRDPGIRDPGTTDPRPSAETAADTTAAAAPLPAAPQRPAPPPVPPLQQALADTAGAALIRHARAEPARALLVLQVDAAYGRLPAPQRAEQAQGWWQRAQELGYERFELLGPGNGLLARSAVVGGGLVLYDPTPAPADDPA